MSGVFNDHQPGDMVSLEMRIDAGSRQMIQKILMSNDEHKALLHSSLDRAIKATDIAGIMQREATAAVEAAVTEYFKWGAGRDLIGKAVHRALEATIPGLFGEAGQKASRSSKT